MKIMSGTNFSLLYNINTLFETDLLKRGQPVAEKFVGGYWKKNHTKIQGSTLFLCGQNQIQVMREYYASKLQKKSFPIETLIRWKF